MTSKERVEAIMAGNQPDRVSVMSQLSMGHIIKNSGVSPATFHLNYYDLYPKVISGLVKKYTFDGCLLDYPYGYDPVETPKAAVNITPEGNGELIEWSTGDSTFCPPNDYSMFRPKNPPKKKVFDEIEWDDLPLIDGYRKKGSELPDYYMKPYHDVLSIIGDEYSVHGFVITPLSLYIHGIGAQDALLGIMDNPAHAHEILNDLTDACITWVDNVIDSGLHAVCVSSPFEGMGFISLEMYNEFALPYTARVVDHVRSRRLPSYMHMCGSINDRLEAIVETGVDGIECLDPPPIGNVDLADAVRRVGEDVFIKGNIDGVNTLLWGTPDGAYEDASARIKTARHTNRYILSTACSVPPDTPAENLEILIQAAMDHGVY